MLKWLSLNLLDFVDLDWWSRLDVEYISVRGELARDAELEFVEGRSAVARVAGRIDLRVFNTVELANVVEPGAEINGHPSSGTGHAYALLGCEGPLEYVPDSLDREEGLSYAHL